MSKLGSDAVGDGIVEELAADGVDTGLVLRQPGAPSPFTYIIVDAEGGSRPWQLLRSTSICSATIRSANICSALVIAAHRAVYCVILHDVVSLKLTRVLGNMHMFHHHACSCMAVDTHPAACPFCMPDRQTSRQRSVASIGMGSCALGGTRTCIHTPGPPLSPDEITDATVEQALDGAALVFFDGRLTEAALKLAEAAKQRR